MNKILFSSKSEEWETPQELFDELNQEFNFDLDPCATHENKKCETYYTKMDNGLSCRWNIYYASPYAEFGDRVKIIKSVFMNPPYGREMGSG